MGYASVLVVWRSYFVFRLFAGLLEGQGDDMGLYGDSCHERNEVERMRHDTSLLKGNLSCAILK